MPAKKKQPTRAQLLRKIHRLEMKKVKGRIADEMNAETQRSILRAKLYQARNTAYYEQERRTVDPTVKRAVSNALAHMQALIFEEPYTPPPVTLGDVVRMESDIARQEVSAHGPREGGPPEEGGGGG